MKTTPLIIALIVALQTSCVVAGYSSNRGWFIWPGSIGLVVIIALLFLFFRRRRY